MHITVYERDRGFVIEKLLEGEFDYIDTGDEVFEADFFRYIGANGILKKLAESYPSPRKKHDVPVWLALGSGISMRLHGAEAFNQYEYVIRCGGMMNAFGPDFGSKYADNDNNGNIKIACNGFNEKNSYPRDTPCHQDYLRKYYRDTDVGLAEYWYNTDVAKLFKKRHAYDKQGLFIGDATYIFVPDNPKYERSNKLLFDKHNHPVDPKKIRKAELKAGKYQWRRCYKLVTLLHVYPDLDCFLIVGFRLLPGKDSELPAFYELLDTFVDAVGQGVVKRLILDRGFLDGERIGKVKRVHGIDVLIPVRKNMDIYQDAVGLIDEVDFFDYKIPSNISKPDGQTESKPDTIAKREAKRLRTIKKKTKPHPAKPPDEQVISRQVGVLNNFDSWSSCPVPLSVVYCRDNYADGHSDQWLLLDTKSGTDVDPSQSRDEYRLRVQIEERYRQLKCFTDLMGFTSRSFSLVFHQIMTVLLAYSLVQLYLRRLKRAELNRKPLPNIRKQLLPAAAYVIVYCEGKVAFLDRLEYSDILLSLEGEPRLKARQRIRRLRRESALLSEMRKPP